MAAEARFPSQRVNKLLRRVLSPALREYGFDKVEPGTAWGWHDDCIWVLKIKAVGSTFSQVTGYPTMSLTVETGMFYTFIPTHRRIKLTTTGQLLPQEYDCHIRSQLHTTLDQTRLKQRLENKIERERIDVWWVEPDLSNAEEVVANIRDVFLSDGVPWFEYYNDLDTAYKSVTAERDCLDKDLKAMHFAKHLGRNRDFEHFSQLAHQEESRIRADLPGFPRVTELK